MTRKFDVIAIGTGSAASTIASRCREAGWQVAVVDSRLFGGTCAGLFPTGQTFVPNIVIIVIGFDGTHGGHVPGGVIAHGSPGGPLQLGRLEAPLAAQFR